MFLNEIVRFWLGKYGKRGRSFPNNNGLTVGYTRDYWFYFSRRPVNAPQPVDKIIRFTPMLIKRNHDADSPRDVNI